jgi:hypothetical protein
MYGLIKERLFGDEKEQPLQSLCEELSKESAEKPVAKFHVLVAFGPSRIPLVSIRKTGFALPRFRDGFGRMASTHIRPTIGVMLQVTARDPFGAAHAATAAIDRLRARVLNG